MLKKLFFPLTVLILFFLFCFYGCKKTAEFSQENGPNNEDGLIKRVQEYLDMRQEQYVDSGKINVGLIKQNAVYENITVEQLNSSEHLIIIPLKNEFKTRNKITTKSFKNIVLIEAADHTFRRGELVEFVPTNQNLTKVPVNTISNAYNYKTVSTDGKISILTFHDRNICDLIYQNGNLKNYNVTRPKQNGQIINPYKPNSVAVSCIDWYWEYYFMGSWIGEEYAFTTCSGCDEEASRPSGVNGPSSTTCGGGGGGGGGGGSGGGNNSTGAVYTTIVSVDTIINQLHDSCIIGIFNQITDTAIKNQIVKSFQELYIGYGDKINFKIIEAANVYDDLGQPEGANSWLLPGTPMEFGVRVNLSFVPTHSREYIGLCIIHEIVHSFVQLYTSRTGEILTNDASHTIIFETWVNQMRDALVTMFNISNADATALALQGMDDILAEEDTNHEYHFVTKFNQFAIDHYGMSLMDAHQTAQLYINKSLGTSCP